jgi:hypothetical protein
MAESSSGNHTAISARENFPDLLQKVRGIGMRVIQNTNGKCFIKYSQ